MKGKGLLMISRSRTVLNVNDFRDNYLGIHNVINVTKMRVSIQICEVGKL